MPGTDADHTGRARYFVISAGRTGSSLLCAILASAGADFGMPADQSWAEDEGAFEHRDIVLAAGRYRAAYGISRERPDGGIRRLAWSAVRHVGKGHLRRALDAAGYFKAVNLDLVIPAVARLGYLPRVIVNYRQFAPHALSLSQMFPHRDLAVMEANYVRTYRNALFLLRLYGGCVVGHRALTDPGRREWLGALSGLTGLDEEKLDSGRKERLRIGGQGDAGPDDFSADATRLFEKLEDLSGRLVPPNRVALRSFAKAAAPAENGAPVIVGAPLGHSARN